MPWAQATPSKSALSSALCLFTAGYLAVLVTAVRRGRGAVSGEPVARGHWRPTPLQLLIGFVTDFFDTLGIGNFAPTTAWYRHERVVPDELILGTLAPEGAQALGLERRRLVPACLAIGGLGARMTIGVGLYAPCMILVSLLGMDPVAAFPIMIGARAFLMPVASTRFVLSGKQRMRAALGLTLGGLPAVLIAANLVRPLPLYTLKWLAVVVVLLTTVQMLLTALSTS